MLHTSHRQSLQDQVLLNATRDSLHTSSNLYLTTNPQAAGVRMATLIQNFSNMGISVIVSFIFGWELTLLILAVVPIIALASAAEMRLLSGHAAEDKRELEAAGKVEID